MISGSSSCNFSNHHHVLHMNPAASEDVASAFLGASSSSEFSHPNSLLYSLSILREKVNQVQSLVSFLVSPDHNHPQTHNQQQQNPESNSVTIANMATIIQEIIVAASSMMFTWQQMAITPPNCQDNQRGQGFFAAENLDWYGDSNNYNNSNENNTGYKVERKLQSSEINGCEEAVQEGNDKSIKNKCDIVELDAAYLLAKYTHYCEICGKGFKRDANLRMHMRAHGDEYKTTAALSNPMKKINTSGNNGDDININNNNGKDSVMKLYSCPQEGCRWNQKHAKFQPLKSMICVKNHYKRSHCPKMYVCKKCNRKQFAVLSDLRTHEKHCGDVKWVCSCGTTFSRKDKLMGHVALFAGHTPAVASNFTSPGNLETHQIQLDDRV